MKSGIRTSEFWMVLATMLFGVAVAAGWLSATEAQEIQSQLDKVAAVVAKIGDQIVQLVAVIAPLFYLKSRTALKSKGE